MMYVYAALLLHEAGKEINENNIRKVLEAAGVQIDEAKIKAISEALKEVNIEEAIKEAQTMGFAPVAAQPAQAQEAKEEKKEEKKEEEEKKGPSEEEISAGLSALFGF